MRACLNNKHPPPPKVVLHAVVVVVVAEKAMSFACDALSVLYPPPPLLFNLVDVRLPFSLGT